MSRTALQSHLLSLQTRKMIAVPVEHEHRYQSQLLRVKIIRMLKI